MYLMNPFLRDFWATPSRNKVLEGGRASSKTEDTAGHAVRLAAMYGLKFLCARKFQNKIAESVYSVLRKKIENSPWAVDFVFTKTEIRNIKTGAVFLFYGIARNLAEIKSLDDVDILWLEEANYLTEEDWKVIEPTIRKDHSEVWVVFNPGEYTDFAYQYFVLKPPPDTIVREVNWYNNPFLNETMLKLIHAHYKRDYTDAEHVYGGKPKMGQDKAVISLLYVLAAIDAHKKIEGWPVGGRKRIGFDVADDGDDKCATIESYGNVATFGEQWTGLEDELLKSSARVFNRALETGSSVTFDSIGVGAQVGPKFAELNEARGHAVEYDAFNAGGKVDDPDGTYLELPHINITNHDHFANIKAQKWDEVAVRFRKTYEVIMKGAKHPLDELISIDSSTMPPDILDILKMELCAPRKDEDGNGRFKVESKKDMKKRGIKSPNVADAFIMAFIEPKRGSLGFFDL